VTVPEGPHASPVREGEIIADKYRVERVLGAGGMGVVVAATHVQLGERVAVKFLLPAAATSADHVERFLREARASARIKSEHVARVHDVQTLRGLPYMVMEYLAGTDLAALLRTRGRLPIAEAVDYVLQACEAIAEAHSLGIIHRDLKPSNLFLTRRADGSALVKVLDFGISKNLTERAGEATATGTSLGSPMYMSPEQITDVKKVDARSDVWALGIMLHELLTGMRPFNAESAPALFVAIATQPPAPVRALRPDAPLPLEAAILRCLEKDPARRMPNVAALASELVPFATADGRVSGGRIMRTLPPPAGSMPPVGTLHSAGVVPTVPPPAVVPSGLPPPAALAPTQLAPTQNAWTDTRSSVKNSSFWGLYTIGFLTLFAIGFIALLVIGNLNKDKEEASKVAPSTASDHGGAPLGCTANDSVSVSGVKMTVKTGPAIVADGNCHFTCTACSITAPIVVQAGGNAVVDFKDGEANGKPTLVKATDNAQVKFSGNALKISGSKDRDSNAVVIAPGYRAGPDDDLDDDD
jgi:serine/threonine-protein kinase